MFLEERQTILEVGHNRVFSTNVEWILTNGVKKKSPQSWLNKGMIYDLNAGSTPDKAGIAHWAEEPVVHKCCLETGTEGINRLSDTEGGEHSLGYKSIK